VPRPKQRTPELRDRVLEAAVTVLVSEGVEGFTTRRIAREAETSLPAVYELFGDKAGLVREVFFGGFRLLDRHLAQSGETGDARADLEATFRAFRRFVAANPTLAEVMFSRPFADFDPGPSELAAGAATREFVVRRVRRGIEAGLFRGDETDIAHVLLALAQGLAAQESAGWLGSSEASRARRWALAVRTALDGLAAAPGLSPAGG
jgi:AcrR family transcriptional regulator